MHNRQNNKESKTYVQGLRQFSNTLPRGVRGILKKNGYNYSEIIKKWNILVGKNIADYASPRSIKMKRGNSMGTLVLGVKRGNEINIEYSKEQIINKINGYFGYRLIAEIKLHSFNAEKEKRKNKIVSNKTSKNFEKKIREIKSKHIRDSLTQLIRTARND